MGLSELIYYAGYRIKTSHDVKHSRRLPAKVLSVGNITAGGTGKTPTTLAISIEALKRGLRPCILTRGYKGSATGPLIITRGMRAADAGDEPLMMSIKAPEVPVVKCADRVLGGAFALNTLEPRPDLFVLDDGFQHRRLQRDVDVLLINSQDPFDNRKLLPMGRLREPLREIRRADAIVLTKTKEGIEDIDALIAELRGYNPGAPVFKSSLKPSGLHDATGVNSVGPEWLKGRDVFGFCGIGDPASFRTLLRASGTVLKGFRAYNDHYVYSASDISSVVEEASQCGAPWLVSTEKDLVRLKDVSAELPKNMMFLSVDLDVAPEMYDFIFNIIADITDS